MNESFYRSLDRDANRCMRCKNALPSDKGLVCFRCDTSEYSNMSDYLNSENHYEDCMCLECMKIHREKDINREDVFDDIISKKLPFYCSFA